MLWVLYGLLFTQAVCCTQLVPPVLDISSLLLAPDSDEGVKILRQLLDASARWGFFHVVGHGLETTEAMQQCKSFFSRPLGWKNRLERSETNSRGFTNHELTKQIVDLKEIFDFGHKPNPFAPDDAPENRVLDGFNQWPEDSPEFRVCMERFYADCASLAERLLAAIVRGLDIPEDAVASAIDGHTSFMRLNYYPSGDSLIQHSPLHAASDLGISRHTDAGLLTVLAQDAVAGLEVYSGSKEEAQDGEWVPVDPVAGALTINLGDMLQVMSNDRLKAAQHRVRASSALHERHSIAFFYNPSYAADIAPLLAKDEAPRYRAIRWGEFRGLRFKGDYADAGREVQIEHYLR